MSILNALVTFDGGKIALLASDMARTLMSVALSPERPAPDACIRDNNPGDFVPVPVLGGMGTPDYKPYMFKIQNSKLCIFAIFYEVEHQPMAC